LLVQFDFGTGGVLLQMPHRQLLADSGMSLPDYDVLTALTVAGAGKDADHSARRTYRL